LPVSGGGTATAGMPEPEPTARRSARLPARRQAGRSGRWIACGVSHLPGSGRRRDCGLVKSTSPRTRNLVLAASCCGHARCRESTDARSRRRTSHLARTHPPRRPRPGHHRPPSSTAHQTAASPGTPVPSTPRSQARLSLRQLPATTTTRTDICRTTSRVSRQRNVTQHLIDGERKLIRADKRNRRPRAHRGPDRTVPQAVSHVRSERRHTADTQPPPRQRGNPDPGAPSQASPSTWHRSGRPRSAGSAVPSTPARR